MAVKLTKLQKVLLSIAAAGMIVVIYDQFGGPVQADASGTQEEPASPVAAVAPSQAAPAQTTATPSIGAQLREMNPGAALPRDPFAPTASGQPVQPAVASSTFAERYRMTGTIVSGNARSAIINGTLVRRGQSIEGYRLIEVSAGSATFESGNERVTLRLRVAESESDSAPGKPTRGPTTR